MNDFPKKGDIYWVVLDPTLGSEINKTRPALVVSNDIGNKISSRVIIAPITSSISQIYPFEVKITLNSKEGKILLDQVRSVNKMRLTTKIASLDKETLLQVNKALKVVFALV